MAASKSVVLTFEIFKGTEFLRREESNSESVTIGKGPAAMLRVEDPALHDLHVVLNVNDDGTVQLHDLAADRSTTVNGQPVGSNVVLAPNDVISIGAVRIVVRIADTAAYADEEATRVNVAPVNSLPASEEAPAVDSEDSSDGVEDVMAYVMRASAAAGEAGADRSRGKVLEVSQVFGDAILGVRHFSKGAKVRVGSSISSHMKIFGVKLGEVPAAAAAVIPFVTLSLGTTEEVWKNPFYVPVNSFPGRLHPL